MAKKSDTVTTATRTKSGGFTAEERAAMKERAREQKAQSTREEGEAAVLAKLAELPDADRALGERLHAIIAEHAPDLAPRTWYGMPAYARDGQVLCFFQAAQKFGTRYATLGFNDLARLDDGTMWPTAYALTMLTDDEEQRIAALVKKAVAEEA